MEAQSQKGFSLQFSEPITWYCNIYLVGNLLNVEGNVAKKGDRYNTTEDYEINGGEKKFMAEEVEVFQVILEE